MLESHRLGLGDVRQRCKVIVGLLQRSSCEVAVAAVLSGDTEGTKKKFSDTLVSVFRVRGSLKATPRT